MKREEWTFEYTAAKLAEAAAAQAAFRRSRFEFWSAKKAEVMRKIRESGLTVHEDISLGLMDKTYVAASSALRGGAQVLVDPTLQKDLTECVNKMQHHSERARQYDGWEQVLRGNPEARVQLDHDDWMYFFGK
jgi:hypothetical protein